MKTVSATDARWTELLDEVERGETIVVTRDGKPVARIVPDVDAERASRRTTMERIDRIRSKMPVLSVEEILSAIHDGRKY